MVMSLMSLLLWTQIRLPSRLWSLHTLCRVLFSTAIMVFALFYPVTELGLVLKRDQGWAIYFCQLRPSQGRSLPNQSNWTQHCSVLRARSVLTIVWVLLVLIEIFIAYRANQFQSRESNQKHEHWSKARTDRLIRVSMDSSSEVWSEEIVRVHDDDHDEPEVDGTSGSEEERDDEEEEEDDDESSTQYSVGQQQSTVQELRYTHPPPEYQYAYRVEVLEPELPPFVYNPFMTQSDCSFACLDMAGSVTTASSITVSSIGSSESRSGPYRNQNSEVPRPWYHR
ncbi:hypothetical protein EC968_003952 [Mortierella alpina]|nr:hypothetical protein EC968_003952 [Mortierella alpina]